MQEEIQNLHSSHLQSYSSSPRSSVRVLPSTLEASKQNIGGFKAKSPTKFSQEKRSVGNEDIEEYVDFKDKGFFIGSDTGLHSQERASIQNNLAQQSPEQRSLYQQKIEKSERSSATNNSASKRLRLSKVRMHPYVPLKESHREKRSIKLSSGGVSSHHMKESLISSKKNQPLQQKRQKTLEIINRSMRNTQPNFYTKQKVKKEMKELRPNTVNMKIENFGQVFAQRASTAEHTQEIDSMNLQVKLDKRKQTQNVTPQQQEIQIQNFSYHKNFSNSSFISIQRSPRSNQYQTLKDQRRNFHKIQLQNQVKFANQANLSSALNYYTRQQRDQKKNQTRNLSNFSTISTQSLRGKQSSKSIQHQTEVKKIMRRLKQAKEIKEESQVDQSKMNQLDFYYYKRFIEEQEEQNQPESSFLKLQDKPQSQVAIRVQTPGFLQQRPKTKERDRTGYMYERKPLLTFTNLDENKAKKQLNYIKEKVKKLETGYEKKEKQQVLKRVLHTGYWRYKKQDFKSQQQIEKLQSKESAYKIYKNQPEEEEPYEQQIQPFSTISRSNVNNIQSTTPRGVKTTERKKIVLRFKPERGSSQMSGQSGHWKLREKVFPVL